jgi:hypothetical protein
LALSQAAFGQLACGQPAFGQTAESAWQQAFAESHTCSVCAAQQESAPAALASAAFLLPHDVTAKENATATAANKTLVFILQFALNINKKISSLTNIRKTTRFSKTGKKRSKNKLIGKLIVCLVTLLFFVTLLLYSFFRQKNKRT